MKVSRRDNSRKKKKIGNDRLPPTIDLMEKCTLEEYAMGIKKVKQIKATKQLLIWGENKSKKTRKKQ